MKRLIPYATLAGETSLEVREARLDGVALHLGMISNSNLIVALHQVERSEWEEARLTVRMRIPQAELDAGDWTDPACIAVLEESRTRTRSVTRLRPDGDGSWSGTVVLHRDHHVAQARLTGHVIATIGGIAGRVIGTTDQGWTVDLKARAPGKQQAMKIVTTDFAEVPFLQPYKADPWTIETSGDEPVVYLNSGFEGLARLLDGGDRGVRDMLSAQIAADAWVALFNSAVYAVEVEDGEPHWPGGWRESVLRRMLPEMFPDRSPDDALSEALARTRQGEGGGDLQTRVLHAAGKQSRVARRLGGFVRGTARKEAS